MESPSIDEARCSVGNRINAVWERPPADVLEAFSSTSVASVSDAQHGHGLLDPSINRLVGASSSVVVGPALTVSISPGNGRMIRRAVEIAHAGDILLVGGRGNLERAVLGGNVLTAAARAGVLGVIVDGAVRDIADARRIGLPLYSRSVCARSGSDQLGMGEVGYPISVGGAVACPGDVVVMDLDGVIVVPQLCALNVAAAASQLQHRRRSL
jgi:4-hydroxy-4-methyl-2-oxoglutarate aldolase